MTSSFRKQTILTVAAAMVLATVLGCTGNAGAGEGEGNCVQPVAGPWGGDGSCFGMVMTNTTDVSGCEMTFREWNMLMSVPLGAVVSGSDVTFTGDGWADCTGTISEDGTAIAGGCSDGCALNLSISE